MALRKIGGFFTGLGKKLETKALVGMYGEQVGKTAKNGNRVFKRVEKGVEYITGVDKNGNVISTVTRKKAGTDYYFHHYGAGGTHKKMVKVPEHYSEKVAYREDGSVASIHSVELKAGKPLTRKALFFPQTQHPFQQMPERYVETKLRQNGHKFYLERLDSNNAANFIG